MANDNVQGLETLEAWKKSKALAIKVYKEILPLLPAEEKWNLNQQIRRSVSSVPANLAEGRLAPAGSRPERGPAGFIIRKTFVFVISPGVL